MSLRALDVPTVVSQLAEPGSLLGPPDLESSGSLDHSESGFLASGPLNSWSSGFLGFWASGALARATASACGFLHFVRPCMAAMLACGGAACYF